MNHTTSLNDILLAESEIVMSSSTRVGKGIKCIILKVRVVDELGTIGYEYEFRCILFGFKQEPTIRKDITLRAAIDFYNGCII